MLVIESDEVANICIVIKNGTRATREVNFGMEVAA